LYPATQTQQAKGYQNAFKTKTRHPKKKKILTFVKLHVKKKRKKKKRWLFCSEKCIHSEVLYRKIVVMETDTRGGKKIYTW
jgi:hypothetical protein